MNPKHKEFFVKLKALLGEYGCEIHATDDGRPWGDHSALIGFVFSWPYIEYDATFVDKDTAPD